MKPIELIKILDSGIVDELNIYYCGGRITVKYDSCPYELPDYEILKLWQTENGRGISILLADATQGKRLTPIVCPKCDYSVEIDETNICPNCGADCSGVGKVIKGG